MASRAAPPSRRAIAALEPMRAGTGQDVPRSAGWVYEPKYDGFRMLAFADGRSVRLMTRNGIDRSASFPDVTAALAALSVRARRAFVMDGEVVAMKKGRPLRFQALQQREMKPGEATTTLYAFDLLVDGKHILLREPWIVRRERLEALMEKNRSEHLALSEFLGDAERADAGETMLARARRAGWEGVMAKRVDAIYQPGVRTDAWLKLKIEHRQELVVGGYTEPRLSREYIGAILVGYYERGELIYAGHTGGGFTRQGLKQMYDLLHPLEQRECPFATVPKTNERAHWVRPKVVVEVKFSEWTEDGKLRQPIYVGTRTDKPARDVVREPESVQAEGEEPTPRRRAAAKQRRTQKTR
jgi:bifunctional non-homologous end joining protein LigD